MNALKENQINYLNVGLMLVTAVLAYYFPFETSEKYRDDCPQRNELVALLLTNQLRHINLSSCISTADDIKARC